MQNAVIYLLALGGLMYAMRTREPVHALLLLHIVFFVAVHSAINVQFRFIAPLMPFLILLAGLPVHAALAARRVRETQAGMPNQR